MGLDGRTILVTRALHQADEFVQAIGRCGGTAIVFPTIEILPPESWEKVDHAIDGLYLYDGVIFTSANGVEGFFNRLEERNVSPDDLRSKLVIVVGEKTSNVIGRYGCTATMMPERFTSADLARSLEQLDLHDRAFLFPRGNLGDDQLSGNLKLLGAHVDSVIVYRTVQPQPQKVDELKVLLMNGSVDVATFTSPSTFKNFVSLFTAHEMQAIHEHTRIAVIGPTTAKAVEEMGFDPDIVSGESTIESLTKAIDSFFRSKDPGPHS